VPTRDGELLLALGVEEQGEGGRAGKALVRSAARVQPEWVMEALLERIVEVADVSVDKDSGAITAHEELRLGGPDGLAIERTRLRTLPPHAARVLAEAAWKLGPHAWLRDADALAQWRHRIRFVHEHRPAAFQPAAPGLDDALRAAGLDDEGLLTTLAELADGCRSLGDLRERDVLAVVAARMPAPLQAALERDAPATVALHGGRRVALHYEADRPPWFATRMQDLFGVAQGPALVDGRVPVVLHLLAPNQRPVQVTTDLAGFWARHYPELRRELQRKYPKHAWPDDPRAASPPPPRTR
jgi:ATP-dependent helicase HrpB